MFAVERIDTTYDTEWSLNVMRLSYSMSFHTEPLQSGCEALYKVLISDMVMVYSSLRGFQSAG